ncbi:hypothetical protein INT47_010282 [Mucor saturninus]|uniref:Uncharacterized protein n=1 Tax=Mucor saturninus TaxID=64648 RepID=A0A8H7UYK0_9FUNG|nr:hypothetical protein INT47_010282 [Mucor saturninus]
MAIILVSSYCYLLTPPFMFTSGQNNILDLTSPGAIPIRFAKAMIHLSSDLQLPLSLTYTTEERAILTKTIRAKSLIDIQDKPAVAKEANVQADIKKGKGLREKRLVYIKSILPHELLISSIEVTSAQENVYIYVFFSLLGRRSYKAKNYKGSGISLAPKLPLMLHPLGLFKDQRRSRAQFHGLSLTIYGSRMTNQGAIIHYQKAVANLHQR